MAAFYRRHFGLFVACGILFNHESPRRPLQYVLQKIAHAAAAVSLGVMTTAELDELGRPIVSSGKLRLGNLDVRRDFGFAGDYAEAMWLTLQADAADDYVIGTGRSHSIRDFCETAFCPCGKGLARPSGGRSRVAAADRFPSHGGAAGKSRASARLAAADAVQDAGRHAGRRARRRAAPSHAVSAGCEGIDAQLASDLRSMIGTAVAVEAETGKPVAQRIATVVDWFAKARA
jgi:nucleoside-diphosphate-sugar epimerase